MNDTATLAYRPSAQGVEHFDVLIVGAGISGVGGAYHLTKQNPGTTFVVLESQETFGGTWWTHKYPGIRSDSDLYTFGYRFKPWVGTPIATANAFLLTSLIESKLDVGQVTMLIAAYMTGDITGLFAVLLAVRYVMPTVTRLFGNP